jgi:hypothetical protein
MWSRWLPLLRGAFAGRARFSPLILMVGAVIVGSQLVGGVPREVEVECSLGPQHESVTSARVAYLLAGREVHSLTMRYPTGAPGYLRHEPTLAPGSYRVAVELVHSSNDPDQFGADVNIPADGRVRIRHPLDAQ